MAKDTGKFSISFVDLSIPTRTVQQDGIYLGRLDKCEVILDHASVSRIHAGINFVDDRYILINLSSANVLTLNGRLLKPQKSDVLADGDTIQIGPFTISVGNPENELLLVVENRFVGQVTVAPAASVVKDKADKPMVPEADGVLKVFWEKRSREKDDWGSLLRPTEKPVPGKSMFNWRPTGDLRSQWRSGLFVWAVLMIGAIGAFAYFRYPDVYAPKPLASPHFSDIVNSQIAHAPNGNSCTTCHSLSQPIENSCISCHQASQFYASNTKAHEQAGITCTTCHKEHQGRNFDLKATAIQSCSSCHNDGNQTLYNGKTVHTPHSGSSGYPVECGIWKWKGVYREVADAIPEINNSATGDKDEQAKLSRHFHTIHVARLKAPDGIKGDSRGLVSCSSCHVSFDPIDRTTPRQTCSICHTTAEGAAVKDDRFTGVGAANCISCHVQHPYSGGRWNEFITDEALRRRNDAVEKKIASLNGQ